jgi:hypothetical protein
MQLHPLLLGNNMTTDDDVLLELIERGKEAHQQLQAKIAAADRIRAEIDTWPDAWCEWYRQNGGKGGGTAFDCGYKLGWRHAEELIRKALEG